MKKTFTIIISTFKWLSIAIGLPIVLWLSYSAFVSAFGSSGTDVSKKDLDFKFTLKETAKPDKLPNILLINADDLGYGDLSCYGSTCIQTPNIDKIATNGLKFINHYTSGAVCSPSRAGLMTGRYPLRSGFTSIATPDDWVFELKFVNRIGKLFNYVGVSDHGQDSYVNGLPHKEITIAEALKQRDYATGAAGKWHLGDFKHVPEFNPMRHGFDDWLGINSANDERPVALLDQYKVVRDNILDNQEDFTQLFAERAMSFMEKNKEKPFFYYLAFTAAHQPLLPSANFKGKSKGGVFGDVVQEMDFYVGKVLESLEKQGLADNTIVLFTSDNGPWFEGSSGGLRGGKGQPFDGAFKVPLLVSWKNHIAPNTSTTARVSNMDLFPTLLSVAGLTPPEDRIIDGKNIIDILTGKSQASSHDKLFFYHYEDPAAVLVDGWKYYPNANTYVWPVPVNRRGNFSELTTRKLMGDLDKTLFNLNQDPNEDYNVSHHYPSKVDSMQRLIDDWKASMAANQAGWK